MELYERIMTQNIVINEIEEVEDNSVLKVQLCIMNSKVSANGWGVKKDVLKKYGKTLINKPIVCKYNPEINNQTGTDCLGSHEETTVTMRGTQGKELIPYTDTMSIGVITNIFYKDIDDDEVELWAEGVLWLVREYNAVSLLYDWMREGIKINASVEWGHKSEDSYIEDNIEWMNKLVFLGLCVLNSKASDEVPVIYGNYKCAELKFATNEMIQKFNNAVKIDIEKNIKFNDNKLNNEEGESGMEMENKFLIALNQISLGDKRDKVMEALSKTLTAEEFNNAWISNYGIYDDYVIYETYVDDKWKTFKLEYSITENDEIQISVDSKKEVEYELNLVEKTVYNALEEKVGTLEAEKIELETSIKEIQTNYNTVLKDLDNMKIEKENLDLTIDTLNLKVNELEPYKAKADKEAYESELNKQTDYYKAKFNALNATDKFESEEVQNLIKETLDTEKCSNARSSLALMLEDLVEVSNEDKTVVLETKNNSIKKGICEMGQPINMNVPSNIKKDIDIYRD